MGFGSRHGQEAFLISREGQTSSGDHPASYWMGNRGSFPWAKRPGSDVDHSSLFSADVKIKCSYTSIYPRHLHVVNTVKFMFFIPLIEHHERELLNPTPCNTLSELPTILRQSDMYSLLGTFAKLRKATISFVVSVSLTVRMEQLGFHCIDFH